jgi:hypothetical protein
MADQLLFSLTYVKQNPIQARQGQRFGMSQSHANKWLYLLHTVLNQTLAQQELLPARTAAALATLLSDRLVQLLSAIPRHVSGSLSVARQERPYHPTALRHTSRVCVSRSSAHLLHQYAAGWRGYPHHHGELRAQKPCGVQALQHHRTARPPQSYSTIRHLYGHHAISASHIYPIR